MGGNSQESTADPGLTNQDIDRIEEFLQKRPYERSVDDLRPSADD